VGWIKSGVYHQLVRVDHASRGGPNLGYTTSSVGWTMAGGVDQILRVTSIWLGGTDYLVHHGSKRQIYICIYICGVTRLVLSEEESG